MTGRERVLKALDFDGPDRIPLDLWVLPAARMEYGAAMEDLCARYSFDLVGVSGALDQTTIPGFYTPGTYTDVWGSEWLNLQAGIIGEVKKPVFANYSAMDGYVSPTAQFMREWDAGKPQLAQTISALRAEGKFINGGSISLFERLQYLRGTEDLYCDIALDERDFFRLVDIVMEYMEAYTDRWLEMDIDAMGFADDWGSQRSLLISPDTWRRIFKPLYKKLIDKIKAAGKRVFFHSDGYIFDLYPEFIELGVDAVNSQLWCMGVEKVAEAFAGKITFWGELSRQDILPRGTPQEVHDAVKLMVKHLYKNGGLIGQSEVNRDVPLANVEAMLQAWNG